MRMAFSRGRVLARERNIVRVDFDRDPEPPAPRFPGAGACREWQPVRPAEAFAHAAGEARVA